jgi:hypothetical protein
MNQQHRRVAEILAVLVVYAAIYLVFVGPALGAAFGFDQPAFSGPDLKPTGDLPDTPRGWLLIVLGVPVLLGYMYVRARVAGVTMDEFWNPDGTP